jgi:hypothetical protein
VPRDPELHPFRHRQGGQLTHGFRCVAGSERLCHVRILFLQVNKALTMERSAPQKKQTYIRDGSQVANGGHA